MRRDDESADTGRLTQMLQHCNPYTSARTASMKRASVIGFET